MKLKEGKYQLMEPLNGEEGVDEADLDYMNHSNKGSCWHRFQTRRKKFWGFVCKMLRTRTWRLIFLVLLSIVVMGGYASYLGLFIHDQADYHLADLDTNIVYDPNYINGDNDNSSVPFMVVSFLAIDVSSFTHRLGLRGRFTPAYAPDAVTLVKPATLVVNEQKYAFTPGSANNILSTMTVRVGYGSVYLYPFDKYETDFVIYLLDGNNQRMNFSLMLGKREYGGYRFDLNWFHVHDKVPNAYQMRMTAQRAPLFLVYPVFQIVAFWFITIWAAGMTISITMYAWKKAEGFLLIVTASMLFALPSFRSTAPQAPPIGCVLDVGAFFWAMFAVLGLFFGVSVRYLEHAPNPPKAGAPPAAPPAAPPKLG